MKNRIKIIIAGLTITTTLHCQQSPLSESYYLDKYTLSPSYAGGPGSSFLFLGYRSDWTGFEGGPKTLRLSYNDLFPWMDNAGYGGRLVYDKAGIFSQLYLSGSYSYRLQVAEGHHVMFGLSTGLYRNRLNLLDYYNDPGYTIDPALISQDLNSKLKFMTDVSAVYTWQGLEAGLMFSNISFGDASYKEVDLKYNPLANFQLHGSYLYSINEEWDLVPFLMIRGGKYIKTQFELASQVIFADRFMGSLVYRDPGIIGFGIGADITPGLKAYYNFNYGTNVVTGAFNNHELTVGVSIAELLK